MSKNEVKKTVYTKNEVKQNCLNFFNGDELAASVVMNKYLLRDDQNNFLEKDPFDMFKRIASEFARIENKFKGGLTYQQIYDALCDGGKQVFGPVVPQGSPMFGIGNTQTLTSLANCYFLGQPHDSYAGILRLDEELAHIYKNRGGAGTDLSTIRPKGTVINNAARFSEGIVPYMERYSNTTKEVAQSGRRGALMITIHCNHPSLEEFINAKVDLKKVTGANVSVKITDEFMTAVKNNEEFVLRFPVDSTIENAKYTKTIKAKEVWDKLIKANWDSAEPGILFWDTMTKQSISDEYADDGFQTGGTNPCLVGSTKVTTDKGDITIEEIISNGVEKYKVLTFNTQTETLELEKIVWGDKTRIKTAVIKLELADNSEIELTPDHKVYSKNRGWIKASELTSDDILVGINDGIGTTVNKKITKISTATPQDVYDITTETNHNFFANNLLVHNCAELPLSKHSSCLLLLLNLTLFVENKFEQNCKFNYQKFETYVRMATRLLDDMVELEIEKVNDIISRITNDNIPEDLKKVNYDLWTNIKTALVRGRRVGLGITGLGDTIAFLNQKYNSTEGRKIIEDIMTNFHNYAYDENSELARERGHFECWSWEKEKNNHYIQILPKETQEKIKRYGRRNIAMETIAPAGSVSILTQTSSGIEPIYMRSYMRNRKMTTEEINSGMKEAYTDSDGIKWTSYEVLHQGLEDWKKMNPDKEINQSPYWGVEANELNWKDRIDTQSICQKRIDHSISSTCGLKKDITVDEVDKLYRYAHEMKLKGVTIYRDGSRMGVLTSKEEPKADSVSKIKENHAPKREKVLPCEIHYSNIKSIETGKTDNWIFMVGLLDGRPYEIFGGKRTNIEIPKKYKTGWIIKNGKNDQEIRTYDLYLGTLEESDERMVIKDIANEFAKNVSSYTRIISTLLRHGTPIKIINEQLLKDSHSDLFAFEKGVVRVLKRFIKDGEKANGTCTSCGHGELQYRDGCVMCPSCGFSRC